MNIVIQLRKVCNHPELLERNEGSTYFYFAEVPNSLLPPPYRKFEDIYYSGGQNRIKYKMPKLVYEEIVQESSVHCSAIGQHCSMELFQKYFNIFSKENVHMSVLQEDYGSDRSSLQSGTFGFACLVDLPPAEISLLATGTLMQRLLFEIMRCDRKFLNGILDHMETQDDDLECNRLGWEKVRAVTRMLLLPTKSESILLRRTLTTGAGDAPFEPLVMPHQDRLQLNIKLLQSTYSYIPRARAPPISIHCLDRHFAFKMLEELHHPWIKRFLVGFARTSDSGGLRKPDVPHPLIEEIDSELPISQPALQLTHQIFGSCPPLQPFDPAKMLTDSGKLQTLDMILKRLRADNHRVLLFSQMTRMLDILEAP